MYSYWEGTQLPREFRRTKTDSGDPNLFIYFAIQLKNSKKLEEAQGGDKIVEATREAPIQLGRNRAHHLPRNNLQKLPRYEAEPLISEAIDEGSDLGW